MPALLARHVLLAAWLASAHCLTELTEHSFRAPFVVGDYDGARSVEYWLAGGTTEPRKHFVRLTPDRQSKSGSLWNAVALKLDSFSITMRFRISGQGKRYFGDGLSLWVTTAREFTQPSPMIVGFTGFGVTLDTFRNADSPHQHRDVLFVTSAGGPPHIEFEPTGCDSEFRYWEGLVDFSARNYSGLRLSFRGNRVRLLVDPRGTEQWTECFRDAPVAAADGWWDGGVYLGLSASTGDLADNHDVLSLVTTLEDEPAPASAGGGDTHDAPAQISTGHEALDAAVTAAAAREAVRVGKVVADLQHDLEHQLASVHDGIKSAMSKLEAQEQANTRRIEALEMKLGDKVSSEIRETLDARIAAVERALAHSVGSQLREQVVGSVRQASMFSLSAVGLLAAVVAAVTFFAWRKYRHFAKMHLP